MAVKYVGPARDYSGYGEANRHDIAALLKANVEVTTKVPMYVMEIADFGSIGQRIAYTENNPIAYDTIILHTTPNVYKTYMEPGKYHIGRAFWETDKLPEDFAVNLELCDEIWTGSKYNEAAIRKSGVSKPIYIIPEAIEAAFDPTTVKPYLVKNQESYKFYSIFEWTERKNPLALLKAYFEEFQNGENVSLSIKTYVDNFSLEKRMEIDQQIRKLKATLNLKSYPPLFLYRNLMDRGQIYRFHKTFDCFISAHRGEGWGIPQMEAMLFGNPVISTNCGGIHEYLENGKSALLLKYELVPLLQNSRNMHWYKPDQNWAEVNSEQLRIAMRSVFEDQMHAQEIGKEGCKVVNTLFSLETVGGIMKKRLDEITYENTQIPRNS